MNAHKVIERREAPRPDPADGMYPRLITIDPDMAERFLEKNTRNRKLNELTLRKIIRDWQDEGPGEPTHQGIAFYAADGALADGQHRLMASVRTGMSFRSWVFWGVSEEAAPEIDRHRPRSEADVVKIAGISNWIGAAELALVKMLLDAHGSDPSTYSVGSLVHIADKVADQIQFATMAFDGRKRKHLTAAPVVAAVAIASAHVDEMRLFEFVDVLITGMPQSDDDVAAVKLRDGLIKYGIHGGRAARLEVTRRTMRAIKGFVNREHMRRLTTPDDVLYQLEALK